MVLVFFFLRKVKMKSPDRVSQHFLITGKWGNERDDKRRKKKEKEKGKYDANLAGSRRLSLDFAAF
jgi:hypothetical protein